MTWSVKIEDLIVTVAYKIVEHRSLSLQRLMNTLYLCDWRHAIVFNTVISSNSWEIRDNRVANVEYSNFLNNNEFFISIRNAGNEIDSNNKALQNKLREYSTELKTVDDVISATCTRTDFQLDRFVISSFPFNKGPILDLISLACDYRKINPENHDQRKSA